MNLYSKTIPDSKIMSIELYGADEDGPKGTVSEAAMELAG